MKRSLALVPFALLLLGFAEAANAAAPKNLEITAQVNTAGADGTTVAPGTNDFWIGSFGFLRSTGAGSITVQAFTLSEYGADNGQTYISAIRVYWDNDNNYRAPSDTGTQYCGPLVFDGGSNAPCDIPDEGVAGTVEYAHVVVDIAAGAPARTVGVEITGGGDVTYTNGDSISGNPGFPVQLGTFNIVPPPPVVTSCAPNDLSNYADGSTTITVTGTDFQAAGLAIDDTTSPQTFGSPTYLSATQVTGTYNPTGLGAGGKTVRVTTDAGNDSQASCINVYGTAVPTITAVNPANGANTGTTAVTITGKYFCEGVACASATITVELITGPSCIVPCNLTGATAIDSDRQLTVTVPAGYVAGSYDFKVTTDSGSSANTAADNYEVTAPRTYPVKASAAAPPCNDACAYPKNPPFCTIQAAFNCVKSQSGNDLTSGIEVGDVQSIIEIQDSNTYSENSGVGGRGLDLTNLTTNATRNLILRSAVGQRAAIRPNAVDKDAIYLGDATAGDLQYTYLLRLHIRDALGVPNRGLRIVASDVTVEDCFFNNNDYAINTEPGTVNTNITIFNSEFFNNNPNDNLGGRGNVHCEDTTNFLFYRNLVYTNVNGDGVHLRDCDSAIIHTNTFYNNGNQDGGGRAELRIQDDGGGNPSINVTVRNNIFQVRDIQNGAQNRYGMRVDSGSEVGLSSNYNVFYRDPNSNEPADPKVGNWLGANQVTLANWQAASGQDANSTEGAPQFVSTQAPFDFRVRSNFGTWCPCGQQDDPLDAFPSTPLCNGCSSGVNAACDRTSADLDCWFTFSNHSLAIDAGATAAPYNSFANEVTDHGNRRNAGRYGDTTEASLSGCHGFDNSWIGRSSASWSTDLNWSRSVAPTSTQSVCIADPAGFASNPTLDVDTTIGSLTIRSAMGSGLGAGVLTMDNAGGTAGGVCGGATRDCRLIVNGATNLQAGATVTFTAGDAGELRLAGNFTQTGTLNMNSGIIEFCAGHADCNTPPAAEQTLTATGNFWKLYSRNSRINTGTCGTNAGLCTTSSFGILNEFNSNGSFTATAGTVTLNGTATTTFTGAAGDDFATLTIDDGTDPAGTITMDFNGTLKINSALNVTDGRLSMTGPDTLAFANGATLTVSSPNGFISTDPTGGNPTIRGPDGANCATGTFAFNLAGSSATVNVNGLDLRCLNDTGLNVTSGPFGRFEDVQFLRPGIVVSNSSRHISLPASGGFTFISPTFDGNANYNIYEALGSTATVTVAGGAGAKGEETESGADGTGESNDCDNGDSSYNAGLFGSASNNGCGDASNGSEGKISWTYPHFTWTGGVNSDWNNPGNWNRSKVDANCPATEDWPGETDGTPGSRSCDVLILDQANDPVMNVAGIARDLTVASSGSLTTGGNTLSVYGNLTKDSTSTFTSAGNLQALGGNGQTFVFSGSSTQSITQLTVNKTVGTTLTLNSKLIVSGTTTVTSGTFKLGGGITFEPQNTLTVNATGTWDLGASSTTKRGNTVTINGTFASQGTSVITTNSRNATETSADPCGTRSAFEVGPGGSATLNVTGLEFMCASATGFEFKTDGVTITNFNNVTFRHAASGGTHLTILRPAAAAAKTLTGLSFDNSFNETGCAGASGQIVRSTGGAGTGAITFKDYQYGGSCNDPDTLDTETTIDNVWQSKSTWSGNWRYRLPVTINNTTGTAFDEGKSVHYKFSVAASPGNVICNGSEDTTGPDKREDFRLMGFNGAHVEHTPIEIKSFNCPAAGNHEVEFWFKLERRIADGGSETGYWFNYGNDAGSTTAPLQLTYDDDEIVGSSVDCDETDATDYCAEGGQVVITGLWNESHNWTPCEVPDANSQVVVDAGSQAFRFSPTLNVVASIRKLDLLNSLASADTTDALVITTNNLTVANNIEILGNGKIDATGSTATIALGGSWGNAGSFVAGQTMVNFNGAAAQSISDTKGTPDAFYNLTIVDRVNGTCSDRKVCPTTSFKITKNFTSSGDFEQTSGTITFSGSTAQALTGAGDVFNNLTIQNTGATQADETVTATNSTFSVTGSAGGTLTIADGTLKLVGATIVKVKTSVDVQSAGTMRTESSGGRPCITNAQAGTTSCTASVAGSNFAFTASGTLDLSGLSIDRVNATGLNVGGTATVTQASELVFTNSVGGATSAYVNLPNSATAYSFLLPSFDANATYNIRMTGVNPTANAVGASGAKGQNDSTGGNGIGGEENDCDPGDSGYTGTGAGCGNTTDTSQGQITWSYPNFIWEGDCSTAWDDGRNWKTHTVAADYPGCTGGPPCTAGSHDVLIQGPIAAGPDQDGDGCTASNNPNLSSPATLTIRDLTLASTANLTISNTSLTASRTLYKSGGATLTHSTGTLILSGADVVGASHDVSIYGATTLKSFQISHAGVTARFLGGPLTINNTLNVSLGIFDLNGNRVVVKGDTAPASALSVAGTLQVNGTSRLEIDDVLNAPLTASISGRLTALKIGQDTPVITSKAVGSSPACNADRTKSFAFNVTATGILDLNGFNFSCANAAGLNVAAGATIAQFQNVNFTNAVPGGTHLTMIRSGNSSDALANVSFDGTFAGDNGAVTCPGGSGNTGRIACGQGDGSTAQANCNAEPPNAQCEVVTFTQYSFSGTPQNDDETTNGIYFRWTRTGNWSGNWDKKRQITFENCPAGSCDANDVARLYFDGSTAPTGADLCTGSTTTPKGNDIRIYYSGSPPQEVPRQMVQTNCVSGVVEIKFKLVNTIGGTPNNDYFLYYGNSSSPNPCSETPTMCVTINESLFTEGFERGNLTSNCADTGAGSCNGDTDVGAALGWIENRCSATGDDEGIISDASDNPNVSGGGRGMEVGGLNNGPGTVCADTPQINTTGKTGVHVIYYRRTMDNFAGGNDNYRVQLIDVTGAVRAIEGPIGSGSPWTKVDFTITTQAWIDNGGCAPNCVVRIRFNDSRSDPQLGEDMWVDDIEMAALPLDLDGFAAFAGTCGERICYGSESPVTGKWSDAFNWSPKQAPDSNTDVIINNATTAFRWDPDVDSASTVFSIQATDTRSSEAGDANQLSVATGATLTINSGLTIGTNGKLGGLREDLVTPGIQANIDVGGVFTNNSGGTLDFTSSSNSMNVAGNFTNSGTFTAGSSTIVLDGATASNQVLTTSSSTTFNNLTISYTGTGDVTTASSFNVGGNLISNGQLNQSAGTVTLNGSGAQTFTTAAGDILNNLAINNASDPAVNQVVMDASTLKINGTTTITQGAFKLKGATTLTQVGAFTVSTNGRLLSESTGGGTPTIQGDAGLNFAMSVQGRLNVNGLILSRLDNNGLNITSGPFIDALNEVQFLNGQNGAGSAYLKMPDATYDIMLLLPTFDVNASYNIYMPDPTGSGSTPQITVQAGSGAKGNAAGGEANDCDQGDAAYAPTPSSAAPTNAGCADTTTTSQGRIKWSFPNFIWDGVTNTTWTTGTNWNPDQPGGPSGVDCTTTDDVLIVAPAGNWPTISGTVFVRDLTLASGTTLNVNFGGAGTLGICGDFFKSGTATFSQTDGTIEAGGGTGKKFTLLGNATFNAFRLNKALAANTLTIASGDLTVNGSSTLDSGILDLGGRTLTSLGAFTVTANGVLNLTSNSTLKMGNLTGVTMNGKLTSPAGSNPTITGNGAPCTAGRYAFTVSGASAVLDLNALNFSCANTAGLNIDSSVLAAGLVKMDNVTFTNALSGAGNTHLTFSRATGPNGFTFALQNASFDNSFGAGKIVKAIGDSSPVQDDGAAPTCNDDPPEAGCEILTFNNFSYGGSGSPPDLDEQTFGILTRWTRAQRWRGNWEKKRKLTINAAAGGAAGDTVRLYFENVTPTVPSASDLYAASTSAVKCDDIRIYYNGAPKQDVPRSVLQCASSVIEIKFKLVNNIAASPPANEDYFLHYGNPAATSPPSYTADVVIFSDNFERPTGPSVGNGWVEVVSDPEITGICGAGGSTAGVAVGHTNNDSNGGGATGTLANSFLYRSVSTTGYRRIIATYTRNTTPDNNFDNNDFFRMEACSNSTTCSPVTETAGYPCTAKSGSLAWNAGRSSIEYNQTFSTIECTLAAAYENNANFSLMFDMLRDQANDEDMCIDDIKIESKPCEIDMQAGTGCPQAGVVTVQNPDVDITGKFSDPFNWTPFGAPDTTTLARIEFGEVVSGSPNNFRHGPDVDAAVTIFSIDVVNTQSAVGGASDALNITTATLNTLSNFTISTNGTVKADGLPSTQTIQVGGNWSDTGAVGKGFLAGQTTLTLNGSGPQTITTTKDLYNLTISNTAPAGQDVTTTSSFKITNGFTSNGKFVALMPSMITYETTGNKTFTAACPTPFTTCDEFFNLTINNTGAGGSDEVNAGTSRFEVKGILALQDGVFKLSGTGRIDFGPSALLDLQANAELESLKTIASEHCDANDAAPWVLAGTSFPTLSVSSGNFSFNSAGSMDFDGLKINGLNNAGINVTSTASSKLVKFYDVCFTGGQNGAGSKYFSAPNAAVSYFLLRPYFDGSATYNVYTPNATPTVTVAQPQGPKGEESDSGADGTGESNDCDGGDASYGPTPSAAAPTNGGCGDTLTVSQGRVIWAYPGFIWTAGGGSSVWNLAANWSCAITPSCTDAMCDTDGAGVGDLTGSQWPDATTSGCTILILDQAADPDLLANNAQADDVIVATGTLNMTGAGNLEILGDLFRGSDADPATLNTGNGDAEINHTGGGEIRMVGAGSLQKVTLSGGGTLRKLVVQNTFNGATRPLDGTIRLEDDVTIVSFLNVNDGILDLNGNTIFMDDTASLNVAAGGRLKSTGASTVTAKDSNTGTPEIDCQPSRYVFEINGAADINGLDVQCADSNGLHITNTAPLDPVTPNLEVFRDVRFHDAVSGGTHVTIDRPSAWTNDNAGAWDCPDASLVLFRELKFDPTFNEGTGNIARGTGVAGGAEERIRFCDYFFGGIGDPSALDSETNVTLLWGASPTWNGNWDYKRPINLVPSTPKGGRVRIHLTGASSPTAAEFFNAAKVDTVGTCPNSGAPTAGTVGEDVRILAFVADSDKFEYRSVPFTFIDADGTCKFSAAQVVIRFDLIQAAGAGNIDYTLYFGNPTAVPPSLWTPPSGPPANRDQDAGQVTVGSESTLTGLWSDPFNWSPAGVPDENAVAVIDASTRCFRNAPTLDAAVDLVKDATNDNDYKVLSILARDTRTGCPAPAAAASLTITAEPFEVRRDLCIGVNGFDCAGAGNLNGKVDAGDQTTGQTTTIKVGRHWRDQAPAGLGFAPGRTTVELNGAGLQVIDIANDKSVYNLTVTNTSGSVSCGGPTSGVCTEDSFGILKNLTSNGRMGVGPGVAGVVTFRGNSNQSLTGEWNGTAPDDNFNSITINNSGASPNNVVTLSSSLNLDGTLAMNGGIFSVTGPKQVRVGTTVSAGAGGTFKAASDGGGKPILVHTSSNAAGDASACTGSYAFNLNGTADVSGLRARCVGTAGVNISSTGRLTSWNEVEFQRQANPGAGSRYMTFVNDASVCTGGTCTLLLTNFDANTDNNIQLAAGTNLTVDMVNGLGGKGQQDACPGTAANNVGGEEYDNDPNDVTGGGTVDCPATQGSITWRYAHFLWLGGAGAGCTTATAHAICWENPNNWQFNGAGGCGALPASGYPDNTAASNACDVLILDQPNDPTLVSNIDFRDLLIVGTTVVTVNAGSNTQQLRRDLFKSTPATIAHNNGTLTFAAAGNANMTVFGGATFGALTLNKSVQGDTVTLSGGDIRVSGARNITTGTLNLNGFDLTHNAGDTGNTTVGAAGALTITGASSLVLADARTVSIAGNFTATPSGGNTPTITSTNSAGCADQFAGFDVTGGTLNVTGLNFSCSNDGAEADGFNIAGGVTITSFSNVAFTKTRSGTTHLTINRSNTDADSTLTGISFDNSYGIGVGKIVTGVGGGDEAQANCNAEPPAANCEEVTFAQYTVPAGVNPATADQESNGIFLRWTRVLRYAGDYAFKWPMTVTNTSGGPYGATDVVELDISGACAGGNACQVYSNSQADGDDFRLLYLGSGTPTEIAIDRDNMTFTNSLIKARYRLPAAINAGANDPNFLLVYGNPSLAAGLSENLGDKLLEDKFEKTPPNPNPNLGNAEFPAGAPGPFAWSETVGNSDIQGGVLDGIGTLVVGGEVAGLTADVQIPRTTVGKSSITVSYTRSTGNNFGGTGADQFIVEWTNVPPAGACGAWTVMETLGNSVSGTVSFTLGAGANESVNFRLRFCQVKDSGFDGNFAIDNLLITAGNVNATTTTLVGPADSIKGDLSELFNYVVGSARAGSGAIGTDTNTELEMDSVAQAFYYRPELDANLNVFAVRVLATASGDATDTNAMYLHDPDGNPGANTVTLTTTGQFKVGDNAAGKTARVENMRQILDVNGNFEIDTGSVMDATLPAVETGTIKVAGHWTKNGTFTAGNTTVELDAASGTQNVTGATTFYNLKTTNGSTANVSNGFTIASGGTWTFESPNVVKLANSQTITVTGGLIARCSGGGAVTAFNTSNVARCGANDAPTLTSSNETTDRFNLNLNGTVNVTAMNFKFGSCAGMNISSSANVTNLAGVSFRNASSASGCGHLTINQNGPYSPKATDLVFDASFDTTSLGLSGETASVGYNVKLCDTSAAANTNVEMYMSQVVANTQGAGGGEVYDREDPPDDGTANTVNDCPINGGKVEWGPPAGGIGNVFGKFRGKVAIAEDWSGNYRGTFVVTDESNAGGDGIHTVFSFNDNGALKYGTIAASSFKLLTTTCDNGGASCGSVTGGVMYINEGAVVGQDYLWVGTNQGFIYKLKDTGSATGACASGVPSANTGLCAIDLNGGTAGVALRLGTNVTAPLFADFELVYAVSLVGGTPTLFAIEQSDTYDCTYYSCDGTQHETWSLVAPGVGQIVEVPAMEETYDGCPALGGPDTTTILHFGGEGVAAGGAGLLARVVVERRDSATCPASGNPSASVPTTLATSGDVVAPTVLGAGLFVGTVAPTEFVGANQTTYAALDNDGVGGADFPYPATKGVPVTLGDVTAEIAYHAGKNWALVGDLNGQLHCVAVTGASAGNRCTVDWPVEPNVAAGYAVRAAPILSAGVVYVVVADGTNSEVHAYDMERKVTVCPSSGAAAGGPCEITSTNNPGTNKGYPYTFGADSRQKGGIMITQTRVIVLLDDGRIVAVPRFTSDPTP